MNKKQRTIEWGVRLADEIQLWMTEAAELEAVYFAEGYNGGGGDAIVDGDFSTANIEHMTAADFTSLITAIQALRTAYQANGNNTAIRKASYGGAPK